MLQPYRVVWLEMAKKWAVLCPDGTRHNHYDMSAALAHAEVLNAAHAGSVALGQQLAQSFSNDAAAHHTGKGR